MYTKFGIHIKCLNLDKSLNFYQAFKFKPVFAYGPKKFLDTLPKSIPTAFEKYRGVTFEVASSLLEIADGHMAVKGDVFKGRIRTSKVSAMIHVESVEKIVKICKRNNFKISVPPKEFPWGTKEVVIKDPDGFVLVFIEKIK